MQYESIILEKDNGVATLTFNRPQKYNAWDTPMMLELLDAVKHVGENEHVKVLIITGADPAFSTGGDADMLKSIAQNTSGEELPVAHRLRPIEPWYSFVMEFNRLTKPVIAAVNGIAVGGGLVISLMSDVVIASEKASFGQVFARRGLIDGTSTFFLPKLLGLRKAMELTLSGRFIDAEEAERIGLVNSVVPHSELMKTAWELATDIARGPAISIQLSKQAIRRGFLATDLNAHTEYEFNTMLLAVATDDFREGVRAFIEKREPKFKGR